jgi:hypothetical protein
MAPPLKNVIPLSKICNKFAPFSEKKNQIEENDAGTVAVEVAHRFYGPQLEPTLDRKRLWLSVLT